MLIFLLLFCPKTKIDKGQTVDNADRPKLQVFQQNQHRTTLYCGNHRPQQLKLYVQSNIVGENLLHNFTKEYIFS
jgi:hypothetical protein